MNREQAWMDCIPWFMIHMMMMMMMTTTTTLMTTASSKTSQHEAAKLFSHSQGLLFRVCLRAAEKTEGIIH